MKSKLVAGKMRGWFWTKVGLDLSKYRNVARVPHLDVFIEIPHAKVIRAQFSYCVESWF